MDISRINTALLPSDLSRSPVKTESTFDKGGSRAASVGATQAAPQTQALVSNDYIKKQLEDILVNLPPWFPAGAPQRLDLIKRIRGFQEQVAQTPVQDEMLRKTAAHQLSDDSTVKEISTAVKGTLNFLQALSEKDAPAAAAGKPGAIVNINV